MKTDLNEQQFSGRRSGRKKHKKRWTRLFLLFLSFIVIAAGYVVWQINQMLDKVTQPEPGLANGIAPSAAYNHEPISLVIMGVDSRAGTSGGATLNTDVMIVATLNPQTKHVTMTAIPRDTGVRIPGYRGWHKVNSVYANGEIEKRAEEKKGELAHETGPELVKKTIGNLLDVPIQHYAIIDFEGFTQVIDKLGGIEVNVDKSMKYDDPADGTHIDLEPGLQTLNGEQALGFVRHRKDNRGPKFYDTDFERGKRQQIVIKAVADKMETIQGMSHLLSMLEVTGDHIHTDLSKNQIMGLIFDFKSIDSGHITSLDPGGVWDPETSRVVIPKSKLTKLRTSFRQEMGDNNENGDQNGNQ
jgi:polyisoprenyl-teichoic acid--peptidoglycan teichoic acid transferase